MFFSKKKTSCFSPFAHHALKKKKKNCNFYFHPRIFCRKKERKKERKNRNQTNVENIIYFRLHDLSSSKWIDPFSPHASLPTHTQDETEWNGRARAIEKTDKSKCNGEELGANFPLDLKGGQVENRFSKFEREIYPSNERKRIRRNLSSKIT